MRKLVFDNLIHFDLVRRTSIGTEKTAIIFIGVDYRGKQIGNDRTGKGKMRGKGKNRERKARNENSANDGNIRKASAKTRTRIRKVASTTSLQSQKVLAKRCSAFPRELGVSFDRKSSKQYSRAQDPNGRVFRQ